MADKSTRRGTRMIPGMRYDDAPRAIEWLCDTFGFERHLVVPDEKGGILHAQLALGDDMIMLGSTRDEEAPLLVTPRAAGGACTQGLYVLVEDVDAHCARARAAGAQVVLEPEDQHYGGRLYSCRDPEGHLWHFGSYDPWAQA